MNRRSLDKAIVVTLTLMLGAGILYLAVPRAVASLSALNKAGSPPAGANRDSEAAALLAAIARAPGDPELVPAIARSIRSAKAELARAPANPAAWTRLSLALYLKLGGSTEMADALRMSIVTGPYDRNLVFVRLELCFRAWRWCSPGNRKLIQQQIRFAVRQSPENLARITRTPALRGTVRSALVESAKDLSRFESALARLSS